MTDAYVRPDVSALLTMLEAAMETPLNEMSVEEARQAYVAMRFLVDVDPTELAVVKDMTCPGPAGDLKIRYYDTQDNRSEPTPAIIFYHGGGFVIGDLESHHPFCTEMAAQMDMPLIAIDYRLAPEHPFPAAPDDCEAATRWIADNAKEFGLEINGLIPCGDSAGGNLAIVVAQQLAKNPAAAPVIAQVPIYPVVDSDAPEGSMKEFAEGFVLTADTMEWFSNNYAGDANDPRCDPIRGALSDTPPTVLVTAGLDPLRDQGRDYGAALIKQGVNVNFYEAKGTVHGFICLRKGIPSGQQDIDIICNMLKTTLATL